MQINDWHANVKKQMSMEVDQIEICFTIVLVPNQHREDKVQLNLRLTKRQYQALVKQAKADGISLAGLVRRALLAEGMPKDQSDEGDYGE